MKKIFIGLMLVSLMGCSAVTENSNQKNNFTGGKVQDIKKEKTLKGINDLMTEEEREGLSKGKSISTISIENPSHGIIGDGIGFLTGKMRGNDKNVIEKSQLMLNNSNMIFVSYNTDTMVKCIKYLSKTEEGLKALKQLRFIFIDSENTGIPFVNKDELKELSEKYGFRYSYPN